ncbi:MAG: U32 family peptidase [Azonexus sp.]|nr:U32 family peptidase [Betaproteobacteria bacterium]MBK8918251.1 U32 family peptidase [Betaproteobacteria bacterium]MBP6036199.1 U32 family peptidase [Azonexus sp.]MBP6906722.1 U32 family peptidase [Azonexus sp.]
MPLAENPPRPLELLAPAKNADLGIAAIDHGADAVYIGGPAFGARAGAGNDVDSIARLAAYAHRYHARVLVAVNTILRDDELEDARRLAWAVWEAGADALIVQDMGLLQLDLPPIQLHASTQTDIRSPEKARFLADVGFSQIVLARELSLDQIRAVAAGTPAVLEFFVHGALCVSYSGQCYISHAHTGRSANRGDCSQTCRLPYSLSDGEGQVIAQDKHLLSMKDNDQSANLAALADAGIGSFKIEGRLKDLGYVKNITAHYRGLLDEVIAADPRYCRASSGTSTYTFVPQPEKSFNRGATDYFVNSRQADIGAFDSPKFVGEPLGHVTRVAAEWFEVDSALPLHNGDGLSYYDADQELAGLRISRAEGRRLYPLTMPQGLAVGLAVYRNRDQEFERLLEKKSADRRIAVSLTLSETPQGFTLEARDEDGLAAQATIAHPHEAARDTARAGAALREQLGKLGNTPFVAREIALHLAAPRFLPTAVVNALRREVLEKLDALRLAAHPRPPRAAPAEPPAPYPQDELSYLGNVLNAQARAFYARHGVKLIEDAYEAGNEKGAVSLMITKHCLRYSFNLCPKEVKGLRPDPLTLMNGKDKLTLRFDCKRCEMHVVGKLRKGVKLQVQAEGH